jgi:hypothetical protein
VWLRIPLRGTNASYIQSLVHDARSHYALDYRCALLHFLSIGVVELASFCPGWSLCVIFAGLSHAPAAFQGFIGFYRDVKILCFAGYGGGLTLKLCVPQADLPKGPRCLEAEVEGFAEEEKSEEYCIRIRISEGRRREKPSCYALWRDIDTRTL